MNGRVDIQRPVSSEIVSFRPNPRPPWPMSSRAAPDRISSVNPAPQERCTVAVDRRSRASYVTPAVLAHKSKVTVMEELGHAASSPLCNKRSGIHKGSGPSAATAKRARALEITDLQPSGGIPRQDVDERNASGAPAAVSTVIERAVAHLGGDGLDRCEPAQILELCQVVHHG